jgi:hypothetical protein
LVAGVSEAVAGVDTVTGADAVIAEILIGRSSLAAFADCDGTIINAS